MADRKSHSQAPADHRRKWDSVEYEKVAKAREDAASKKKASPSDRPVRPTVVVTVRPSDRPSVRNCSNFFEILKSSLDALDRLYRPDRPRVVEVVLNNSFQKK